MRGPCSLQASSPKRTFSIIGPLPQAPLKLTPRNFTLDQYASTALKNPAVLPVQREAILQNGEGQGEALICFAMVCALNPTKTDQLAPSPRPQATSKTHTNPKTSSVPKFQMR